MISPPQKCRSFISSLCEFLLKTTTIQKIIIRPIDICESHSLSSKKADGGGEHDLDILATKIVEAKIVRPN
jgi:hypothetical protein